MTHSLRWILLGLVVAAGIVAWTLRSPELQIERISKTGEAGNGPAMCPWRNPDADMKRFFAGSTSYRTDWFALGRLRQQILANLGPGSRLDSNSLYAYRVLRNNNVLGTVLVQRASAPHGAIEVVAAVSPEHKIVGVQIQRQREPDSTAKSIESHTWLGAFIGKDRNSDFSVGAGVPDVAAPARPAARVVASTVRALLIEFALADTATPPGTRPVDPGQELHSH